MENFVDFNTVVLVINAILFFVLVMFVWIAHDDHRFIVDLNYPTFVDKTKVDKLLRNALLWVPLIYFCIIFTFGFNQVFYTLPRDFKLSIFWIPFSFAFYIFMRLLKLGIVTASLRRSLHEIELLKQIAKIGNISQEKKEKCLTQLKEDLKKIELTLEEKCAIEDTIKFLNEIR